MKIPGDACRIKTSTDSRCEENGHHGESRKYGMMDEYVERVKNSQVRIQQVSCLRKKVGSRGKVQRTGPDDQGLIKHYDVYTTLFFFRTVHSASNRAVKEPVVPLRILTAEIPLQ